MSAPQLSILALEPFYGGTRRSMLETMVRCSRHRWTVLKLPPRRIERRLSVAANWFAGKLTRHWVGHVDLLFTSEAMNLANFHQLMPQLADTPSVVYFHENQLPDVETNTDSPLDLVNLSTATAATEIWFNSRWHQQTFLTRAAALVGRHPELAGKSPVSQLRHKASVMTPPVETQALAEARGQSIERDVTALFVDTRDADIGLLNSALRILEKRKKTFRLITVGRAEGLPGDAPHESLADTDDSAQARALCQAGVVVSVKSDAASDFLAIRGLLAGCRPVLPASGCYPELLTPAMRAACLYDLNPVSLADRLQEAMSPYQTEFGMEELRKTLAPFNAPGACRHIDERFEELVWVRAVD